jgi:hypothetical protein
MTGSALAVRTLMRRSPRPFLPVGSGQFAPESVGASGLTPGAVAEEHIGDDRSLEVTADAAFLSNPDFAM